MSPQIRQLRLTEACRAQRIADLAAGSQAKRFHPPSDRAARSGKWPCSGARQQSHGSASPLLRTLRGLLIRVGVCAAGVWRQGSTLWAAEFLRSVPSVPALPEQPRLGAV
jgi:hypothetical protein